MTSNYANYAKLRFFWDLGSFANAATHFILAQDVIWTDPMCQSLENGPKLRFWANFDIIMLIMRERDFSRACGFLQMLINTLYLLNMRYGTDPMTQF